MKKTRKAITREIFDQARALLPFVPVKEIARIVKIGESTIYHIKKHDSFDDYSKAGRDRYEAFNAKNTSKKTNPKKLGRPKKVKTQVTSPTPDMTDTYLTKSFEMMVRQTEATEALVNATRELVAAWKETPRN